MNAETVVYPRQIVFGIDGSPDSSNAVDLLRSLPGLPACRVLAVSVVSGRAAPESSSMAGLLQQVQERLQSGCAEVKTAVLEGHPAEVLVRTAAEVSADLIVLGARGQRSAFDFLLGGVAGHVIEHAGCPVWVVRSATRQFGRVLLALDGSECSQRALDYLAAFGLPAGANVEVVGVAPAPGVPSLATGPWPVGQEMAPILSDRELEELERLRKEEKARLQALVEAAAVRLNETGKAATAAVLEGDPAGMLLKQAANRQVDLLVAGSRGLSAIRGWLLGSVSRRLVQYAPVSVLVVKGQAGCDVLPSIEDG